MDECGKCLSGLLRVRNALGCAHHRVEEPQALVAELEVFADRGLDFVELVKVVAVGIEPTKSYKPFSLSWI